ncbi:uncharacterized protein LOC117343380 [Pecten maximus]|uniref:uncharacterized protein LOC117343380 n=1 Tax=Pecten maximus TaxID=6579 RepID=UPI0014582E15|nr:uncharacterized protein LOC117343380 [Pecten maximus]
MEEVLRDFYKCGLCEEPITYPKKLKCQHVFCHECLVVYITEYFGKASFPCPVCDYKHSPGEEEEVISQDSLLILQEDDLQRDVRRFFQDGEEPEPAYNANGINRAPCIIHDGKLSDFFCSGCNTLACEQCRLEIHGRCDFRLRKIDKDMRMEAFTKTKEVSEELTNFLSETETVYNSLNSKLGNIFLDSVVHDETIKSYYSELKEKVVKYLEEQERKVLENANKLRENEKTHLERDAVVCTNMSSSVKSRQRLAHALQKRSSTNAAENLVITNHLGNDFEVFKTMLSKLQSDADTSYNVRFMINTELEDKMTDTDIVKIEVIHCCHRDASAATFDEVAEADQQVSTEPNSAQTRPDRSPAAQISQNAREEIVPPPPPDDGEEEPPPSYRAVTRQSFIQRPRPWHSSVVRRRPSASAPPLPAYDNSHTPIQHPYPPHVGSQSPNPSSCAQMSHIQPTAPPLYMEDSSPLSSDTIARLDRTPISPNVRTITMLNYIAKVETKTDNDDNAPYLVSIATLGRYVIVADQNNRRLQRMADDGFNGVVDQFDCSTEPYDVAGVSDTVCVVAAPKEGSLLFVEFSSTPGASPAKLQRTMKTGKYLSVGYCKSNGRLICGRGPPFSAARIEIVTMQGYTVKQIDLKKPMSVSRNLTLSQSRFLALCDVRNKEAIFYDTADRGKPRPTIVRRREYNTLREPQGIATIPTLKSVLILDTSTGDVIMTSYSGYVLKVLSGDVTIQRYNNVEVKYSMSVSTDQKLLAIANNRGSVSFYEIKYM